MTKQYNSEAKKFKLGNYKMQPVYFSESFFADNVMIVADSCEKLQFNLEWRWC